MQLPILLANPPDFAILGFMDPNRLPTAQTIVCRETIGYLALAVFAAIGFLASVTSHVLGWLQIVPPGGLCVFALHIGIFVVWIPLVFCSKRSYKPGVNSFNELQTELPKWVRNTVACLFAYAMLNFAYFMYSVSHYPNKHATPLYVEIRGFSGHWMLFYGVALTGFIALIRLTLRRRRNKSAI